MNKHFCAFAVLSVIVCTAYSSENPNFGDCQPLKNPIGVHPHHGLQENAGTYLITRDDNMITAKPVCNSNLGWEMVNKQHETLKCKKHSKTGKWRWEHHPDSSLPLPHIRCSHNAPPAQVQSFTWNGGSCDDLELKRKVETLIKSYIKDLIGCVSNDTCNVLKVSCDSKQDLVSSIIKIEIISTGLTHLADQRAVVKNAVDLIKTYLAHLDKLPTVPSLHRRHKRQFDGLTPQETEISSCNEGQVEHTNDDNSISCITCQAGTFANTETKTCDACDLDKYSGEGATTCTACTGDLGTLSTSSDSVADCVAYCTVPTVGKTSSLDPAAGQRVLDESGTVTVSCENNYNYGGNSVATVTCKKSVSNSNFPASCRYVSVTAKDDVSVIMAGESAMLTCTSVATDEPDGIKWYFGTSGTPLVSGSDYTVGTVSSSDNTGTKTSTSTLEVLTFASTDTGDYRCEADYAEPFLDDVSADLTIGILDVTIDPSTEQVKSAGDTVQISCLMNIDNTFPNREIKWYQDSTEIISGIQSASSTVIETSTVQMNGVTTANSGIYKCSVTYKTGDSSESVGPIEKSVSVVVQGFTVNPADTTVDDGAELKLTCTAQGSTQATITWKKTVGGVDTDVSSNAAPKYDQIEKTTESVYTVSAASSADSGVYECTADFSGANIKSTTATVAVYDLGIETNPVNKAYLVGEDASLSCTIKNPDTLDSQPSISWIKKGDTDEVIAQSYLNWNSAQPTGTATLMFSSVTADKAGSYVCQAVYTVGGDSVTRTSTAADLYIRELTVKLDTDTLVNLPSTTPKIFTCKYSGDDGVTNVEWTYNGESTLPSGYTATKNSYNDQDSTWETTLTVDPISKSSGGTVMCSFSGSAGEAITSSTNFVVHEITALESEYVSNLAAYTVTCKYSGTDEPSSVVWTVSGQVVQDTDDDYDITAGTLLSNDREDELVIKNRAYSDAEKTITCKYTFQNPSDTLESSTKLIYRGIHTALNENYETNGDDVTLECSLGVGSDGSAPGTTSWYKDGSLTALQDSNDYKITTDTTQTNGLFKTSIVISNIKVSLAGSYKCSYEYGQTEKYDSTTTVTVRMVVKNPTDAILYNHKNAEYKLTCTLSASDTPSGKEWTGPDGAINDADSTLESNGESVLTLKNPTSSDTGSYECKFNFATGNSVTETFSDVKIELIEMVSPENVFSTTGGVTVSLRCQVGSSEKKDDLNWWDGSQELAATTITYQNGKTSSVLEIIVNDKTVAKTYSCRLSADEISTKSSTLTVLDLTQTFTVKTFGNKDKTAELSCEVDFDASLSEPTISWYKGDSPASENPTSAASTDNTKYGSKITVTFNDNSDKSTYHCTASYPSGLAASTSMKSVVTTIVVNAISIDDAYQIIAKDGTLTSVCTATGPSDIVVKWRKNLDTDEDLSSSATPKTYNTVANTLESTLSISSLTAAHTSDKYECYITVDSVDIVASLELDVVDIGGMADLGIESGTNAIFTCTYSKFDKVPTVEFFKKGSSDDIQIQNTVAEISETETTLTLTGATSANAGTYYCQVTYNEQSEGDVSFKSTEVNLLIRSLTSTKTPSYVKSGDSLVVTCEITVATESEIKNIKWYKGLQEIVDTDNKLIQNDVFGDYKKKTTYTDSNVSKDDGGAYKCEFNFNVGEPISAVFDVEVHLLTAFETTYINPTTLDCVFSGTHEPNIVWKKNGNPITFATEDGYAITTPGSWDDNAITQTITINPSEISGVIDTTSITCALSFAIEDSTDTLETSTVLHFRRITKKTPETYNLGETTTLTCEFDYGENGIGPDSVSWTGQIDQLTETTHYTVDEGSNTNGRRITKLTLISPTAADYPGDYTCNFVYPSTEKYDQSITVHVRSAIMTHDQYVHTNAEFKISCTASGDEDPTGIKWYKATETAIDVTDNSGTEFTSSWPDNGNKKEAVLTKATPLSDDDGKYTCEFQYDVGTEYLPTAMGDIVVSLLKMTDPTSYYGAKGDNIDLVCTVTNDVKIDIYWYKGTQPVSNTSPSGIVEKTVTSTLSISSLDATSHDGIYECRLSQSDSLAVSTNKVTLTTLDFTKQPESNYYAKKDATVVLTCTTNYALSGITVDVTWGNGDDNDIQTGVDSKAAVDGTTYSSELTLTMTSDLDRKDYSCVFTFSGESVGTDGFVTSTKGKIVEQKIEGLADKEYLVVGGSISLTCNANGDENTDIVWKFTPTGGVEETITGESTVYEDYMISSTYEKSSVTVAEDDGSYSCEINSDNTLKETIEMDVYSITVSDKEVKTGSETKLTCAVADITTKVSFAWEDTDGNPVQQDQSSDTDLDSGAMESSITQTPDKDTTYKCTVTDELFKKVENTVKLNIFEVVPASVNAKKGNSAAVTCLVSDITKKVSVTWKEGDTPISTTTDMYTVDEGELKTGEQKSTLTVLDVQKDRTFTCSVTSGEYPGSGPFDTEAEIKMFDVSVDKSYQIIKKDGTLTSVCTATGDNTIDIKWRVKGTDGQNTNDLTGSTNQENYDPINSNRISTLTIENLDTTHTATYECYASMGDTELKSEVELNVVEISDMVDIGVKPTEDAVFECSFSKFDKEPTVEFFKEGADPKIDSGIIDVSNTKKSLTISNAAAVNGGNYYCKVTYKETEDPAVSFESSKVALYVRSAIMTHNQYVHTNAEFKISCIASGDEEPTGINWYKATETAIDVTDNSGTGFTSSWPDNGNKKEAVLTKVTPLSDDDGKYTCEFQYDVGTEYLPTAMGDIVVSLLKMDNPTSYYGAKGDNIDLVCTVTNDEKIDIYWYKEDQPVTNTSPSSIVDKTVTSTLSISSLDAASDDGVYECRLSQSDKLAVSTTKVTLTTLDFTEQPKTDYYAKKDTKVVLTCTTNYALSGVTVAVTWGNGDDNDIQTGVDSKAADDGKTYSSELTLTMTSDLDRKDYSCVFLFSGVNVGTDGSVTSTKGKLVEQKIEGLADKEYLVDEGTISLTCNAYGDENTDIVWKFTPTGGVEETITGESTVYEDYMISSTYEKSSVTVAEDDGYYSCEIISDNTLKDTIEMDVYFVSLYDNEVKTGSEAKLTCSVADISEQVTFTWKDSADKEVTADADSDTILDGTGMKSTITASPDKDTTYTCTVTDALGETVDKATTMNVFDIALTPASFTIEKNLETELTCTISGHDGNPTISWFKVGSDTALATEAAGNSESKHKVSVSVESMFYCSVVMKSSDDDVTYGTFKSDEITISVRDVTTSFSDTVVVKEDSVSLTCTYTGGNDVANVVWKFEDSPLNPADDSRYVIKTGNYLPGSTSQESSLTINGIAKNEGGAYRCVFNMNTGAPITRTANLDVFFLTELATHTYNPSEILVSFSGTYEPTLKLSISGNEYEANVNNQFTKSTKTVWSENSIVFAVNVDMSKFPEGQAPVAISIELSFGVSSTEKLSAGTTIYKREIITKLPATVTVTEETKDFNCVASGSDNTKYSILWFIDDAEIKDSDDTAEITEEVVTDSAFRRTSTLTITNDSPLYNGIIKCSAKWNDPEDFTVDSTSDVDTIGSSMASKTYSNSDGHAILTCLIWGNEAPAAPATWEFKSKTLTDVEGEIKIASKREGATTTNTLTLTDMSFGDEGDYTCHLTYADSSTKEHVTTATLLYAKLVPSSPYFVHDGTVQFSCIYSGQHDPEYVEWFTGDKADESKKIAVDNAKFTIETKDYEKISSSKTSIITVNNAVVTDSGDYHCKWQNPTFAPSATMTVTIRSLTVPPKIYSLDGSIEITCTYGGIDTPAIEWYHGDKKLVHGGDVLIDDGNLESNSQTLTLTIKNANTEKNAGKYTCKTSFTDKDTITAETEVVVRTAAIVNNAGETQSSVVVNNGELSLKCMFIGEILPDVVKWYKDGSNNEIVFDDKTKFMGTNTKQFDNSLKYFSNVTIKNFGLADEGTYSCKFTMSDNEDPETSVPVLSAEVTNDECVFVDSNASADKSLSCEYAGSKAATSVTFTDPNDQAVSGTLGNFESDKQSGSYTYSGLTEASDGTYKCTFTLEGGVTVSAFQRLSVRKAMIETSAATMAPELIEGSKLTLTCTVNAGANSIKWYKDGSEFSAYKEVSGADTDGDGDDLISIIYFKVASGSAGVYKCEGTYYDDYCPSQQKFSSADVTLKIIDAVAKEQPSSATVLAGAAHKFECVFPDPFGNSKTPEISWNFNGMPILSNGDYYSNGEKIIDGTIGSDTDTPAEIKTSMNIVSVTADAAGKYKCSVKWGSIYIESNVAVLTVRAIKTPPVLTNVVEGSEATLTCVASGDTKADITFHKASDHSSVDTVSVTEAPEGSIVETTGKLTMTAGSTSAGDYYCKASWGADQTVKSDNVYLAVLGLETMDMSAAAAAGQIANFICKSDGFLQKNANGNPSLTENGNKIYPTVAVTWEYSTDSGANWLDTSGNSKFNPGQSQVNPSGVRFSPLIVGPVQEVDDQLQVRCKVAYTTDDAVSFIGGDVTSEAMTLSFAKIVSFSQPTDSLIQGDIISLTCVAKASSEPTFSFKIGSRDIEDDGKYEKVEEPTVTPSGDEYTVVYKTKAITTNVINGGNMITCIADYGPGKGQSTKDLLVTVFFDCNKQPITSDDSRVTINKVENGDGSVTATGSCPDNTDTVRYVHLETDSFKKSATCQKKTGDYTPSKIAPCGEQTKILEVTRELVYDISTLGFTVCQDDVDLKDSNDNKVEVSTGEWTKENIYKKLKSTTDDTCGLSGNIRCLKDNTCTIKTTQCSFAVPNSLTILFTMTLDPPLWTVGEVNTAKENTKTIQWYQCDETYSKKKRSADENIVYSILQQNNATEDEPNTVIRLDKVPLTDKTRNKTAKVNVITPLLIMSFCAIVLFAAFIVVRKVRLQKAKHEESPISGSEAMLSSEQPGLP